MKMITSALITLIAAAAFANEPAAHTAPTAPAAHDATATTPDAKVATADAAAMEAKCKKAPKTKECVDWKKATTKK